MKHASGVCTAGEKGTESSGKTVVGLRSVLYILHP